MTIFALICAGVAAACAESVVETFQHCELDGLLSAESGEIGDVVTVTGRPFTEVADTEVRVGGVEASVLSVDRVDCTVCDACIEAAACSPCGSCDACDVSCETCIETTTFEIPELAGGAQDIVLINAYGSTAPLPFEVNAPEDTDETDGSGETDETDAP